MCADVSRKDTETNAFGKTLNNLLHDHRLKQQDLSKSLNVTSAYVSALRHGTKTVSAATVEKISAAIGVSQTERVNLHRAAAMDMGFVLELPDDFDDDDV